MADASILKLALMAPSEDAISLLEELLASARSGEVLAVAVVEVRTDGTRTAWSESDCYHKLNSGAARLAQRLAALE